MLSEQNDDFLTFADEEASRYRRIFYEKEKWKVIIVDDEQEVHHLTRMVLSDFEFDGKPLDFISAYSED